MEMFSDDFHTGDLTLCLLTESRLDLSNTSDLLDGSSRRKLKITQELPEDPEMRDFPTS